ncbi:MAG TPA: VWA domain-containing protein [Micromonosporaceae bacterium]
MHVTAHLDVDVIAVETEDEVSVLVELTAQTAAPVGDPPQRPTRTLQVVLDRSGSMSGRIEEAVRALVALVDRLEPADNFGVVSFDNVSELTVPAGPLTNKPAVKEALATLHGRNSTNLSDGYLRGLQEATRVAGPAGATLLLVSDGHANEGVTDPDALGTVSADAYRKGIVSSTLGWGEGYDERLLSAIARAGNGNEGFAADADAAVALLAGEVEGLLTQTAQAASLTVRPAPPVTAVRVVNDLPTTATADGAIIAELGSFYSGETRKVVVTFAVPSVASLGLARIATLELTYVELPALTQHTVNVPLHVNVVPGDQAAGRVPDPVVRTEMVYQRVQQAKRTASRHLSAGEPDEALAALDEAQRLVRSQLEAPGVPPQLVADLRQEAAELRSLNESTVQGQWSASAKSMSSSSTYKSRQRGRAAYGSANVTPPEPDDDDNDDTA